MKGMNRKSSNEVFHTINEHAVTINSGSQPSSNRRQIYNLKRLKYEDETLEAIDAKKNKESNFVRKLAVSPEFTIFLATETHLKMEKKT